MVVVCIWVGKVVGIGACQPVGLSFMTHKKERPRKKVVYCRQAKREKVNRKNIKRVTITSSSNYKSLLPAFSSSALTSR